MADEIPEVIWISVDGVFNKPYIPREKEVLEEYNCGMCEEIFDIDDLVAADGEDGSDQVCYSCAISFLQKQAIDLTKQLAELVSAIDEARVVRYLGVFNLGDDPRKVLTEIAVYDTELGAYFERTALPQNSEVTE